MRSIVFTFAAVAALASASVTAAQEAVATVENVRKAPFPSDAELQKRLDALVEAGDAKGVVLGLIRPDGSRKVLIAGSAGEGKAALSAHSPFEIGSVTKTFTGVLLAEAVRRGEVKLADPVTRHLPKGVRVPERGGKKITLLDLATHSAGLPKMPTDWDPIDDLNPYAGYDSAKLYKFLSNYELPRDIGGKPEYSNLGMALLGQALANAAKAPD
jgi:CubicO group peptidase (beta-lactamase class C family)